MHPVPAGAKRPTASSSSLVSSPVLWLLIFSFRVFVALYVTQTADVPDEWWQSTEVAYHVVFNQDSYALARRSAVTPPSIVGHDGRILAGAGGESPPDHVALAPSLRLGHLSWEWHEGIRSYIYPVPFAAVFYALKWLGLDTPFLIWASPKVLAAAVACGIDYYTYFLANCHFGRGLGLLSLTLSLLSWFTTHVGVRTQSNTAEALVLLIALSQPGFFRFVAWCGLGCALRISFVLPCFPVALLWLLRELHVRGRRLFGREGRTGAAAKGAAAKGAGVSGAEAATSSTDDDDSSDDDESGGGSDHRHDDEGCHGHAGANGGLRFPRWDKDLRRRLRNAVPRLDRIFRPVAPRYVLASLFSMTGKPPQPRPRPLRLKHLDNTGWSIVLRVGLLAAAWLLIIAFADYSFYGQWLCTPLKFAQFNVVEGLSALFGVHSQHWYVTQALPAMLGPQLLLLVVGFSSAWTKVPSGPTAVVGMKKAKRTFRLFCLVVVFTVVPYSFLAHKEFRFVYPVLPLLLILTAWCWTCSPFLWSRRKLLAYGMTAGGVLMVLFFEMGFQRGTLDAIYSLQRHGALYVVPSDQAGRPVVDQPAPPESRSGFRPQQPHTSELVANSWTAVAQSYMRRLGFGSQTRSEPVKTRHSISALPPILVPAHTYYGYLLEPSVPRYFRTEVDRIGLGAPLTQRSRLLWRSLEDAAIAARAGDGDGADENLDSSRRPVAVMLRHSVHVLMGCYSTPGYSYVHGMVDDLRLLQGPLHYRIVGGGPEGGGDERLRRVRIPSEHHLFVHFPLRFALWAYEGRLVGSDVVGTPELSLAELDSLRNETARPFVLSWDASDTMSGIFIPRRSDDNQEADTPEIAELGQTLSPDERDMRRWQRRFAVDNDGVDAALKEAVPRLPFLPHRILAYCRYGHLGPLRVFLRRHGFNWEATYFHAPVALEKDQGVTVCSYVRDKVPAVEAAAQVTS